jgi:hypothetical protein
MLGVGAVFFALGLTVAMKRKRREGWAICAIAAAILWFAF